MQKQEFGPEGADPFRGQPRRGCLSLVVVRGPQVKTCGYSWLAPAGAISQCLCTYVVNTVFAILSTLTWPRLGPMMRRNGSDTV